ncbi:hypothetical protein FVE85_0707 [Porphyridium purpureum]|uniref:Uncharacterized protein n=1 Tax=Porphyridium purpureum TaxID=35688 RepID=A0A5J4Z0X2_PORPP|nr:hypothetical protein FVE85_0707 [Porphyridium purpureum]|eukprot:POR9690..scf208_2
MGAVAFLAVLRILTEEDEVNAWVVKWLHPQDTSGHKASQWLELSRRASTADDSFASGFDVKNCFDDHLAPHEVTCLPFLPQDDDLKSAVVWDFDVEHLNQTSCGAMISLSDGRASESRFSHGVMMSNTSMNPLPVGVSLHPGHRYTAFRTRYGFAYTAVGSCSDGSTFITLYRLWENFRFKLETFNTTRIELRARLLSYPVLERSGLCFQACATGACKCWRLMSRRRQDQELSAALTWSEFVSPLIRFLSKVPAEIAIMRCQGFLGNGQFAFQVSLGAGFQSIRGSNYRKMSHLKFLFLDRLTTVSSMRHIRTLPLWSPDRGSKPNPARNGSLCAKPTWVEEHVEGLLGLASGCALESSG